MDHSNLYSTWNHSISLPSANSSFTTMTITVPRIELLFFGRVCAALPRGSSNGTTPNQPPAHRMGFYLLGGLVSILSWWALHQLGQRQMSPGSQGRKNDHKAPCHSLERLFHFQRLHSIEGIIDTSTMELSSNI
jgi:hypothetical protein